MAPLSWGLCGPISYTRRTRPPGPEVSSRKWNLFLSSPSNSRIPQTKLSQISKRSENLVGLFHRSTGFFGIDMASLLVTDPSGIRFSVTGNILGLDKPRSVWGKYFGQSLPVGLILSQSHPNGLRTFARMLSWFQCPCRQRLSAKWARNLSKRFIIWFILIPLSSS
jgi:hypothetical protein